MQVELRDGLKPIETKTTGNVLVYDDFGNLINFVLEVGPRSYICANFGDPTFAKTAKEYHLPLVQRK
jgi:hypothetical protein